MDSRVRTVTRRIDDMVRGGRVTSFDDLARVVNLSPSRLRHLFKQHTGMSPAEYLRCARMNYARELMETTFLSVKQVRAELGFNDGSHFTREFKRIFGDSPRRYREQHLNACAANEPDPRAARPVGLEIRDVVLR